MVSGLITSHQPALPLSTVLGQSLNIQSHISMITTQPHHLHTCLHGAHQGQGLLSAQTLTADLQRHTLETVEDGDQVTATDTPDINTPRNTGDQ